MFGCIRLVNPDRGTALAAISGRLIATSLDFGASWSIDLIDEGVAFWPGRYFGREEIEAWAAGCPMDGTELSVRGIVNNDADDALGCHPPAANDVPSTWPWHNLVSGCLDPSLLPSRDDIVWLAREALRAQDAESLPYLDRFEIWACDRETERPLALVMTALHLEEAETILYSPYWRFTCGPDKESEILDFEGRLNARTCLTTGSGSVHAMAAIFERLPDGSAIQHGANGAKIEIPTGKLPSGLLAEPWETERRRLVEQCGTGLVAGPGRRIG